MYLTPDYRDLLELFNKHDVKYLIAGAYAMAKVGYARSTYDIDIWIEKTPSNALVVVRALEEFGVPYRLEPDDFMEPQCVVQIGVAPNRIDILTDIDGVTFEEAWKKRQRATFDNLEAWTLHIDDLIRNKAASNRPKDRLDLAQLQELAGLDSSED